VFFLKAVVYRGPENIRVEEVPKPTLALNEVLVRFRAGSICGTDLHFYRGDWEDLTIGRVIGHDACGVVEETGERVAIIPIIFCGSCRYCLTGRPNLCEKGIFMSFDRNGLFSELIAAPDRNLVPMPDNVSFEEAAVLEPVALALNTFSLLSPKIEEWVTVIGQGAVGLLMTQLAKISGCRVIAMDPLDYRLRLSKKYRADVCINPKSQNVVDEVKSVTSGGSDIVIEAAGRKETVEQTAMLVRPAGKVALVGSLSGFIRFGVAGEAVFFSVYGPNPLYDYKLALDLISKGVVDIKGLITHRFPLKDFEKAIKIANDPSFKPVKVVILSSY
jgi:threonine dehydrogenase-like Zn-dependent dehydrogenase